MKIFILIFSIFITLYGAKIDEFAKESSYFRDYNLALKVAQKEDKIIMLVLVADFCPWCKKFERKTLKNESISKLVKQNFIPVIVDNYRDTGFFPKELYTSKLPTIYFINPFTQKVLNTSTLYVKQNDFSISIKEALKLFQKSK